MSLHLSRHERRRGSRRGRSRSTKKKADKFLAMHREGKSRGAIAAALGLPIGGIDELLEIAKLEESKGKGRGEGNR